MASFFSFQYVTLTIILIMLQAVVVALWIFMRHTVSTKCIMLYP